ncbi:MAG: YcbK family protein [Deltaproteobacteria bacterium]
MRLDVLARVRAAVSVLAGMLLAVAFADTAAAKPTGWQSESELRNSGPNAWAGYGESGYVARPKSAARAARAKSKAFKSYGAAYGSKSKKVASKTKLKKYAALDTGAMVDALPPAKSLTGGGVRWAASASCLNGTLRSVVTQVASYAPVTVNSTCRSKSHNRKVGGASKSHHLTGDAVDFRVHGNVGAVYAFLRSNGSLGGVKHYGGGLFHIDTGPKRSW